VRKLPAFLASVLVVLAVPAGALAQAAAPTVTLQTSATKITIGAAVTLSGTIDPAAEGETVEIRDAADAVVATPTTDADGDFSVRIEPQGSRTVHAVWGTAESADVTIRVRATIDARITSVRLFDDVTVRGSVEPARPGRRVEVQLLADGRVVDVERVEMGRAGNYTATFRVMTPGTYRARASFSGLDLLRATDVTTASSTPQPSLPSGSHGVSVELLEARLLELHYRLVATGDGDFDYRTADAVIAFHKVQRMPRTGTVDAATWRALADPLTPRPEHTWRGVHFEVDQTRQVAMVVEDGEITAIFHVSTGKPSTPPRDGLFRVVRKLAGYSAHRLYYPSYFDGNRAFHGWPEVPTYAASHGCVRVPYWNALWVYGLADLGTRVAVYH
jgi:hypothetical protein